MVKVVFAGGEREFASRGLASQFVRACIKAKVKARIVTDEFLPAMRYATTQRLKV